MNKNKKRLSKLLIPMLAVSGMNVNAMENVKRNGRISRSVNKTKPSEVGPLIENRRFKQAEQQYVIQYGGPALDRFNEKYEILPTSRYRNVMAGYNLDGFTVFGEAAGYGGSVSQCRDRQTGEILAVKYIPNFKTTRIKTRNSEKSHSNDWNNEQMFYDDYKMYWKDKTWALKYYDFFRDNNGAYAVTEWVDSATAGTLEEYLVYLSMNFDFAERVGKFAYVATQLNQIIDDLKKQNKENSDLHERNIMVVKDPKNPGKPLLKVVDNGWYTAAKSGFETRAANVLLRHFRNITSAKELYYLSKQNATIYSQVKEALKLLNAEILEQCFVILGDSDWFGNYTYEAKNRDEFVHCLNEIEKLGKKPNKSVTSDSGGK